MSSQRLSAGFVADRNICSTITLCAITGRTRLIHDFLQSDSQSLGRETSLKDLFVNTNASLLLGDGNTGCCLSGMITSNFIDFSQSSHRNPYFSKWESLCSSNKQFEGSEMRRCRAGSCWGNAASLMCTEVDFKLGHARLGHKDCKVKDPFQWKLCIWCF